MIKGSIQQEDTVLKYIKLELIEVSKETDPLS